MSAGKLHLPSYYSGLLMAFALTGYFYHPALVSAGFVAFGFAVYGVYLLGKHNARKGW